MAEVHEIHEEYEVEPRRRGIWVPIIMFLLGGVVIAGLVVAFLNVSSTISWPAGQVSLGPSGSVADAGNAAIPPSTATTPSVIAPSATQNEPTVDTTPPSATATASPPATTTAPVGTDDSETESSTPPSNTTTTPSQPE